jgi:Flp pilus assembly protein TadG
MRTPSLGTRTLLQRLVGQRGAAAVELAIAIPVLLVLFFGIVEFSRAYSADGIVTAAAREGARVVALNGSTAQGLAAVQAADGDLNLTASNLTWTFSRSGATSCSGAGTIDTVMLTIRYRHTFSSAVFGRTSIDVSGVASMRCGA